MDVTLIQWKNKELQSPTTTQMHLLSINSIRISRPSDNLHILTSNVILQVALYKLADYEINL